MSKIETNVIETNVEVRGNFITETSGHDLDSSSMRNFPAHQPAPKNTQPTHDIYSESMRGAPAFQK
jgi:hypothetical protein